MIAVELSAMCVYGRLGYKCYHIPTKRMYVSRHLVFDEMTFAFLSDSALPPTCESLPPVSTWLPVLSSTACNSLASVPRLVTTSSLRACFSRTSFSFIALSFISTASAFYGHSYT